MSRSPDPRLQALAAALLLALPAAGCATSDTMVMTLAPEARVHVEHVRIAAGQHAVGVKLDDVRGFEAELKARLYAKDAFTEGNDLTVEYSFINYDAGTQVKGYTLGLVEKPGMQVLIRYLGPDGAELSKIAVGGHIQIGNFADAAPKAADEAADYTIAQFK